MKYYFLALATIVAICVGCATDGQEMFPDHDYHAPPAAMLQHPGPMVDGPGPGVMPMMPPAVHRQQAFASRTTQVRFVGPAGMLVGWQVDDGYAEEQIVAPGRYNFSQGATYRLKLINFPDREGLVLYPSLQVYPAHPTTDAYLAHNSVPLELTDEDLDQVESNNFVTKVIYLPDPKFQEPAIAGVETLVSTRLDPGVDPVAEADRRGTIMVVLRMGNMDLEMPQDGSAGDGGARHAAFDPRTMHGGVDLTNYQDTADEHAHRPPTPISTHGAGINGVPHPMIMGGSGLPGQGAPNPVSGMGNIPVWGQPMTATPIGLPGPAHLPLGGPAGLRSHTMRNRTDMEIPDPVDHMLIDVRHEPGLRMPPPVKHIQYTERHPTHRPEDVSMPAWARPQ